MNLHGLQCPYLWIHFTCSMELSICTYTAIFLGHNWLMISHIWHTFLSISLSLKGVCHEIFYFYFSHDSNPSGPLMKTIFWIQIRFLWDMWSSCSKIMIKNVIGSMNPLFLLYISNHCHHYSCVHQQNDFIWLLWLVMYTTESDSAIRYTPQSLTQRYDTHRGVWLSDTIHTAESRSLNISLKSKPKKIFYAVYQGPRWVQIMKK